MKYLVYTILYDNSGNFLLFHKLAMRYFFCSEQDGAVYPQGIQIKGGQAYYTFPGGNFSFGTKDGDWKKDADVIRACQREFIEECGRNITFEDRMELGGDDLEIDFTGTLERFSAGPNYTYAGYFVQVSSENLNAIDTYISQTLSEAQQAMLWIQKGKIKDCAAIGTYFANAPTDNELGFVHQFGLADEKKLKINLDKYPTDWF